MFEKLETRKPTRTSRFENDLGKVVGDAKETLRQIQESWAKKAEVRLKHEEDFFEADESSSEEPNISH